jgi:hypothetical protein
MNTPPNRLPKQPFPNRRLTFEIAFVSLAMLAAGDLPAVTQETVSRQALSA